MPRTLYCVYDNLSTKVLYNNPEVSCKESSLGWFFGVKPNNPAMLPKFQAMTRRVGLKTDLRWREVDHLQNILRKSNIWDDFPDTGLTIVNAEFRGGDEEQRIDILYMRSDGGLLPCELKIGGTSKDTHGQLIRYIADLNDQNIDLAWVKITNQDFIDRMDDKGVKQLESHKLTGFLNQHEILPDQIRLIQKAGILIDELFPSQLQTAVQYLNSNCGFNIRLLQAHAFVEDDWVRDSQDFLCRLDLVDVTPGVNL